LDTVIVDSGMTISGNANFSLKNSDYFDGSSDINTTRYISNFVESFLLYIDIKSGLLVDSSHCGGEIFRTL
jgi:hypothetical protein